MPKTTLALAALLIVLGLGAYAVSSSNTALLPAGFGAVLLALALLARQMPGAGRALLYVSAVVALLGALAPAAALAIRAAAMSPLALSVNVGMLVLCGGLLVLMIRSMVGGRR